MDSVPSRPEADQLPFGPAPSSPHVRPDGRCPRAPLHGRARGRDRDRAGRTAGTPRARSTPPTRPAPSPTASTASRTGRSSTCSTCSRTRRATGLHVGHPLGLHRHRRLRPLQAHDRPQRAPHDGLRRLRPARPSSTRCRPASTRASPPRPTSPTCAASCGASGLGHDPRRSVATTDVAFYRWTQWIFLQIFNSLVRPRRRPRPARSPSSRPSSTPAPGARSRHEPGDRPWAELDPRRAPRGRRRPPPRLPARGAGQLVPRAGHGAGQRGGHRRRPLASAATSPCSGAR